MNGWHIAQISWESYTTTPITTKMHAHTTEFVTGINQTCYIIIFLCSKETSDNKPIRIYINQYWLLIMHIKATSEVDTTFTIMTVIPSSYI